MSSVFEIICRDDDSLFEFLPALQKIQKLFIFLEDNETERYALIKFNDFFELGFMEEKYSNDLYFVVNQCPFNIREFNFRKRYLIEINEIATNLGFQNNKTFVNQVLLPWVCHTLQTHFDSIDLSKFYI